MNATCRFRFSTSLTAALALGAFAVVLATFGRSVRDAIVPDETDLRPVGESHISLEVSPDPIQLGVVNCGQSSKATFSLTNHGARVLLVERVESGCPCLTIEPKRLRIRPSEREVVAVTFDPSEDPSFHGGLSIDISGYSNGILAFRTVAEVEVPEAVGSSATRCPEPAAKTESQP